MGLEEALVEVTAAISSGQGLGPDPQRNPDAADKYITTATLLFPNQDPDAPPKSEQAVGESPAYNLERMYALPHSQRTYDLFCNQAVRVAVHRILEGTPDEPVLIGTASLPLIGLLKGLQELGGWVELDDADLGDEDPLLAPGLQVRFHALLCLTHQILTHTWMTSFYRHGRCQEFTSQSLWQLHYFPLRTSLHRISSLLEAML